MKILSCADLGVADCNFVARGQSEQEVIGKMMSHAKPSHPDLLKTDPKQMVSLIKEQVPVSA